MRHDDICIITRTTVEKNTTTHVASNVTHTFTETPINCRLGASSGSLVQGQPQGTFTKQLKFYIPNILANIKSGDIATLNGTTKYIVGNIYTPNRHHLEVNVTYKEEV